MPKANDFVCTLAPIKNLMVSNNNKEFYDNTSWLKKKAFQSHPEPVENRLSGWPSRQGQSGALSKGASRLLLLETLALDVCLNRDLQHIQHIQPPFIARYSM